MVQVQRKSGEVLLARVDKVTESAPPRAPGVGGQQW
jgi:hypothetical protein